MTAPKILALDIGTSSTKSALFNQHGLIEAEASAGHPVSNPAPGWQEQDPRDWWRSTVAATRALTGLADVSAVVLSGTMQNVIAIGDDGEPLRPAILYSDSRASEQFREVSADLGAADVAAIIGNHPNQYLAAFKLRWLRDNEPGVFDCAAMFHSGAKDYIIHRLTGEHVTDPTAATTVGAMDIAQRQWHRELLHVLGVPEKKLPEIKPSSAIIGPLTERAASELGLAPGLPVVNGVGDAGASTLGAGLVDKGQVYIHLGTTGWTARIANFADISLPAQTFVLAHPDASKIIEVVPLLSGGDCIEWLMETLNTDLESLAPRILALDAAPPDLLFLPYLKGERSPFVDEVVRGSFLMIDRAHGPADMLYAAMEGVALSLRGSVDVLQAGSDTIHLVGGGLVSALWPQLIADASRRTVKVAANPGKATAFGAFREAAKALGWRHDDVQFDLTVAPRSDRVSRSERRHRLFLHATQFVRSLPYC